MTRRALLAFALVVLAGWGSDVGSTLGSGGAASTWTLRIAQTGASPMLALGSLDPAQAGGFFATQLLWSTCAFLYDYPDAPAPAGGLLQPEVATKFPTVSRRGSNYTYTIRVRSGFRYQDGTAVTAADFAHAIRRSLDPGVATVGPSVLHNLVGVAARGAPIFDHDGQAGLDLPTVLSSTLFCAIPAGLPATPVRRRRWPARTTSRAIHRAR